MNEPNESAANFEEEIIVIDDTPANLHLLTNLLKENGYVVRPFPSGKLALDGIQYTTPSLILLDIQMPHMNGYEVCQQLKANELTADIPVIFISALDEMMDKLKAFTVGGVDYITKPFQTNEALARIATHLELSRLQRMLKQENFQQAQQLAEKNRQLQQMNQALEQSNQELKQRYAQLQAAQLQIVQSEKMSTLGNLVAGVAHEINNPLGFLAGNIKHSLEYIDCVFDLLDLYEQEWTNPTEVVQEKIQTIELSYIREDFPQLIGSMEAGVDRIYDISTSLRTFSRADSDRPVPFNLHEGIDSTILILKHRLKAGNNRPEIQIIKNYGQIPEVKCFAGQLNQVFMNILANGIDALEEANQGVSYGEINNQITITTKLSLDQKHVIISIKDNGKGMSAEVQEKIFEHLFTTKAVGKGTGLGLAIARQIIEEKHGGTINVVSELGQGTEFTITLPIN